PPRPGGLGPFPRSAVAAPRLLRASRPTDRAGSVGGAAGANDHLRCLVRALRPPPAARACDAAPSGSTPRSAGFWCMSSSTTPVAEPDVLRDTGSSLRLLPLPLLRLTPPHGQHASPEAGSVNACLTAFAGDRAFVYLPPQRRTRCRDRRAC